MAETLVFSDSFTVSETKGAQGATVKRTVRLKERLPGDERMFSRVYVSKEGIVTGGVFAEDAGLPDDPKFGGHEGIRFPAGTSEQRPADGKAVIRYNTELQAFEANEGGVWVLPFQGVNLRALESDIIPKVQSAQVYQLDIGTEAAPFKSGSFGKIVLVSKSVLSDEDKAPNALVNFNGTLYFGGLAIGGVTPYTLPVATNTVLGGVKAGSGVSIDQEGVISAASSYTLPKATATTLGGVKAGSGVSIDSNGVLSAAGSYTLPIATASVLGGVKVGTGLAVDNAGVLSASIPKVTVSTNDPTGTPADGDIWLKITA